MLFAAALVTLLLRFLHFRKPAESGFLWALAAVFLALQTGAIGRTPRGYLADAVLILVSVVVETSYFMAFHDELTALPARRAFNQALLGLPETYAVAAVDIDHFKKFNDTFGRETGDQVLRMVSAKLAQVSGGGEAFRVGGEEFSILFRIKSAREAAEHLGLLRAAIEASSFRVRGGRDRRTTPRGTERRKAGVARRLKTVSIPESPGSTEVSVTRKHRRGRTRHSPARAGRSNSRRRQGSLPRKTVWPQSRRDRRPQPDSDSVQAAGKPPRPRQSLSFPFTWNADGVAEWVVPR